MFQYNNSDVDEACERWLKKHGLWNENGFGPLNRRSRRVNFKWPTFLEVNRIDKLLER